MTATLDAIGRPVTPNEPDPPPLSDSERAAIDNLAADLVVECIRCKDPHRAMSRVIGLLASVQLERARGKGRPSTEQERAVAGPHRAKKARKK